MIKQLRQKFIAVAMLSMFLVLTVIMGAINIINYQNILEDADNILTVLSDNGGYFPREKHPTDRPDMGKPFDIKNMSPETPYETRYFTVTLNSEGTAVSVNTGNIAAIKTSDAITLGTDIYASGRTSGTTSDYRYQRLSIDGQTMIIFLDCHKSLTNFRTFLWSSILVSLVGLVSVFILVIVFSKMVFKPVAESDRKQKQFITDAGHEIKTPLTIIDANTEVLEMTGGENEWTRSIRNQVRRLTELTAGLIALARLDEGCNRLQKMDFSLSDAVAETAQGFQALALTQDKTFTVNVPQGLTYCGHESSIRQLTAILLDNALKYSPEGSTIRINLEHQGRGFKLTVYNTAPSVDTAGLEQLFERFYRADGSRNSQSGGYGIGLSIARAIVIAHKGKITASSDDGQSLTFTVIL